jgi:hypothetical protein
MGLAALHAAREPLSLCMSVVPFETPAVAVFRRRLSCGEDADSTGGRPAFGERARVCGEDAEAAGGRRAFRERAGAGDFFLAAIRSLLSEDRGVGSTIRQGQEPLLPMRRRTPTIWGN